MMEQKPSIEQMEVIAQRQLTPTIYELQLRGALVQKIQETGQFVQVQIPQGEHLLRRPLSISSWDKEEQILRLIYRTVGQGTKVLSTLRTGNQLNVFGPLGHGFPIEQRKAKEKVLLVGGGVGLPPLYQLAKELNHRAVEVTCIIGAANEKEHFYIEEFKKISQVILTTDDGSLGLKGHVGQALDELSLASFSAVYACGPKAMLKTVEQAFSTLDEVYLSLEERMACGLGACYGCVVASPDGGQKKVCSDGPVFKKGEVCL